MPEIHVQRKCSIETPKQEKSRLREFGENFGVAVIIITFALTTAILLEKAGYTLDYPSHAAASSNQ